MATAIAYPSDPVTQGATEIQATTFNGVAADYATISWANAQAFMRKLAYKVPLFPRAAIEDPTWTFYVRKDLVGASAADRNLIGVHVTTESLTLNVFSGAKGIRVDVPIVQFRVEVMNWHPVRLTLTDLTIITRFNCVYTSYIMTQDPESNNLLYNDGSHRVLTEAQAFVLLQVAANKPTNAPAINAFSGIYPL